ncbi:MAG: twin-arginine translocase TatA/TatE family subunit [Chlamydiia bacterium]|nr:twin-arginine translocase TatA/TatE family subunit [Chlamydiia bacterium]
MLGTGEIVLILGAATLLFGGKKIPEFARNLGKGLFEFKRAVKGEEVGVEIVVEPEKKDPSD